MELKEAFLDFFHFSLPLKEQIRNSEMPVVFVDFEGKVFKEDDRVKRYSWEAENGSWVKAYLIPNERTIYLCNNKFEKYVKRGLLVTINIECYRYKINSNLIPYLTKNEFNDINSFSKALIESIEKSLNQEKSKGEFFMGKMKERTIELSDLACKLTYICAVSNYGKKMEQVASKDGERFGWINNIKDPELKTCYVRFVIDINWETETITYYASMPYTDVVLIPYNVFSMCDEPGKYRILSIDTRAHKYTLFNSDKHTDWIRNMFSWMAEYYIKLNAEDIQKINESKTNEEETTMSTTNGTNKQDRIKVINQVEVSSHIVNDSLVVEEIDMLHLIDHVILNAPATIVFWKDGTKTVVKCKEDDVYDPEKGIAMAFTKKVLGNNYNYINKFNTVLRKAKTVEDDSTAKITFKNNEDTCNNCSCGSCSCDETPMESNISIATAVEITKVLGELANQIVEIRKDIEALKTKKKKKKE